MAKQARTVSLPGSAPTPVAGERVIGPADPDASLAITILLRRNPDAPSGPSMAPTSFNASVRSMTRHEAEAALGAADADIELVREMARAVSLDVQEVDRAGRRVVLSGSVKTLEQAFGVKLVQHEADGRAFVTYSGDVHLPATLDGVVTAVLGLDERPRARPA